MGVRDGKVLSIGCGTRKRNFGGGQELSEYISAPMVVEVYYSDPINIYLIVKITILNLSCK